MSGQARIVVIGGGVIGCAIAYHLARAGERDVLVLEKAERTHGSTWHAAGLVGQLRSKRNLTRLMQDSVAVLDRLEAESGEAIGWHKGGSIRIASSPERLREIRRALGQARAFGLEAHEITAREAQQRFPWMTTAGVVGAAWIPSDGHADPYGLTRAFAAVARRHGVALSEGVRVTGFAIDARRIRRVLTDQGAIGIRSVINGPIPVSADGEPVLGRAPELDNLFVACGFTAGIAAAGGAGAAMARWILEGDPGMDLWPLDIRRFHGIQASRAYLAARSVEAYGGCYAIHGPHDEARSARDVRLSPLHDRLVAHEHRAAREAAVLIDQTSFAKLEVTGRGALGALQRIAANDLDRPDGTCVDTPLLNERGGIEADLVIMRLAADRFWIVTGAGFGVRDFGWIRRHLPADVAAREVTAERAVLSLVGPRSRAILARATADDVSADSLPHHAIRAIEIGSAPVHAARIAYTGELGFDRAMDERLLGAYFDGPAADFARGRMIAYKAMCDLLWTLWGLIQHSDGNPAEDFWAYATRRLERCRALLADPAFARHLAAVAAGPKPG